jgi:UDP-N-acetylmuramoyl-tripeptide--D-alanyl-D-alanine ligase
LARPEIALVNNAGTAHIGELGSREAIAQAKGEIFEGLANHGVGIINADDAFASYWRDLLGARKLVDFGLDHAAAVTAKVETVTPSVRMRVSILGYDYKLEVPAVGRHNALNALAAAAVAFALNVPSEVVSKGLAQFRGIKGRLQSKAAIGGAAMIDDTYNANPDSVKAAIDVLVRASGKRVLVLGDLGELGALSPQLHREVGRAAREAGVDRLFTLGEASALASEAFGPGARHFREVDELVVPLLEELSPHTTVLVKGSRFMRMERVVERLAQDTFVTIGGKD